MKLHNSTLYRLLARQEDIQVCVQEFTHVYCLGSYMRILFYIFGGHRSTCPQDPDNYLENMHFSVFFAEKGPLLGKRSQFFN